MDRKIQIGSDEASHEVAGLSIQYQNGSRMRSSLEAPIVPIQEI